MPRRYAILGTGALGGYYGGLLARAGFEVHFLARSDAAQLQANGLRVDSKNGDFYLPKVNAYSRPQDVPACDVAIVALKSTENRHLQELLPPLVGDSGVALVLQNGLSPEADAAKVIGDNRVLGGCCFLCCNKVGPGHIRHLDYGPITMGVYRDPDAAPGLSPTAMGIAEDLRQSGVRVETVEDLWQARWTKLVWNVPFNGLSVVLNATTDRLVTEAEELVRDLMREVVAAAASWGRQLGESTIEKMIDNTRRMAPYASSMSLDFQNGRPMEIEAIFGAVVRAAAAKNVPTPRIEMLYRELQFLQTPR